MKTISFHRLTLSVALLAAGAFCPDLHAGWSNLQGNNHSSPARSPAPSRPAPAPRPEPAHTAPPVNQMRPEPSHPATPEPRPEPRPEERPAGRPDNNPVREHPPLDNRDHAQPRPVERTPDRETDRRRMDIDANRRQSYFWSDYHAGMRIDRLPDGYRRFGVHGHDFFYFGGVFYDNGPTGYVVVAPPLDADISDLPPGAETVQDASGNVYYYAAGAFYVQQGDGYVVVAPPLGVTITDLPPGAVATVANGLTYYQAYGVWYQPVFENGVTVYLTVPPP